MEGADQVLKKSANRCVRLERRAEGCVIVKRFEQQSLLGRAFDGRRARREVALLEHLARAGVDVPRPLGRKRAGRGIEVELEWIEGARPLTELAREGQPLTARLARRLGALLAGLHNAGVDHPDLHAGNVLVTPEGRAVAIDFDKARRVRAVTAALVERDLVSLCAGMRESTRPAWRAVVLAAWWRELGADLRATLRRPDAHELEQRARARRLQVVESRARRWTRPGSAVQRLQSGRGFARVGASDERIARALAGEPSPAQVSLAGSAEKVHAAWKTMARLEEHGLDAPRCWLLLLEPPARAWFEREPVGKPPAARDLGRWIGTLTDRGLSAVDLSLEDLDTNGLRRPVQVEALPQASFAAALGSWTARIPRESRAEFLCGVAEAWRGPRRELKTLLAQLQ